MIRRWLLALLLAMCFASIARAGLGPENICLVVNSRSWASRTIANHYATWRNIPATNIVEVDWSAQIDTTDLNEFRLRVLVPVLKAIQDRGLAPQIDAIVYSADFPYAVRYATGKTPDDRFKAASITSLTAFAPAVLAEPPPDFGRLLNPYAAKTLEAKDQSGRGFRSRVGRTGASEGEPIYLSAMLAYTSGRGTSVREALEGLKRSVAADGTAPKGTIYFCRNADVRSTTREPGFAAAVAQLKKLGVNAEILNGQLPDGKRDVAGAMIGAAQFDWGKSGAQIRAGAICENLTSYGGIFHPRKSQTPLSEFLRYGAAGASGTVIEPFAIAAKFPDARIQVCYAEGATLLEAFYQSVLAPYQLIIVGEPLCAPWAKTPTVKFSGLAAKDTIDAPCEVRVATEGAPAGYSAASCEWFVDGLRVSVKKPDEAFQLDPAMLTTGAHELRAVVIGADARATQARAIAAFLVPAKGDAKIPTLECPATAELGDVVTVKLSAPGAAALELLHEATVVGQARGAQGTLKLNTSSLGVGPVRLQLRSIDHTGKALAESAPLTLDVTNSPLLTARHPPVSGNLKRGPELTWARESTVVLSGLTADWLAKAGVPANTPFQVTAWFDADRDDLYQFQARFNGKFSIAVDGRKLFSDDVKIKELQFVPVSLKRGPHLLEISGQSAGKPPALDLRFGNSPVDYLEGDRFRHVLD